MFKKSMIVVLLFSAFMSIRGEESCGDIFTDIGTDILLEFKGAYFLATDCTFRKIYDNGGALYGPEATFKLMRNWYGFASVDVFYKKGKSLGQCNDTKVQLIPLGIGVKYMAPFCWGDLYLGLGFQPTHIKTTDCSPYVCKYSSKWGYGGIAKIGVFFDLPCNFALDFFIDYSFVQSCLEGSCCPEGYVQRCKADVSGTIFGVGLAYRFN